MTELSRQSILDRIRPIAARYEELNELLADPEVTSDPARLREYAQEQAELEELVCHYQRYLEKASEVRSAREMLAEEADEDMRRFFREEFDRLEEEIEGLMEDIKALLLPKDPRDDRNVIMEIRGGTGGVEAALFAADLFRMYSRLAERMGWKVEVLSTSDTGKGGLKEIVFRIKGRGVYSRLKYERGVHRVQRVPETEASGRIHTSTATVAVLPEPEEVEVDIRPDDIRMDVFRSQGAGGQSVNTTDSAVRLTHLPTGLIVTCQDERSQLQNRTRAMQILRARLYEMEEEKRRRERGEDRRAQVGTGERAEKIRTYNFPQSRVTDHRINFTSHRLEGILTGELDELVSALAAAEQAERLQALAEA